MDNLKEVSGGWAAVPAFLLLNSCFLSYFPCWGFRLGQPSSTVKSHFNNPNTGVQFFNGHLLLCAHTLHPGQFCVSSSGLYPCVSSVTFNLSGVFSLFIVLFSSLKYFLNTNYKKKSRNETP